MHTAIYQYVPFITVRWTTFFVKTNSTHRIAKTILCDSLAQDARTTFDNILQYLIAIVSYNNLVLWRANSVCTYRYYILLKTNLNWFTNYLVQDRWGNNDVIWRHVNLATIGGYLSSGGGGGEGLIDAIL